MKTGHKIFVGLACLVILIGLGVFLFPKLHGGTGQIAAAVGTGDASTTDAILPPLATSTPATPEATQGMRSYQNVKFHFGLLFPDNLKATEYQEQGGALTASFQDPSTSEGFEVYVTPFSGTQITESRFKLDEPSGTFLQPTNVVIGGTQATMFYGHNSIMGDTREVWFVHGGYLYEVTTYKELDSWLGQIMQTWKFI